MTALANRTNLAVPVNNANAEIGLLAMWDALSEATEKPELDIASASTCDIGGQASAKLRITGTTTITSFGTVYRGPILIRMAAALTITHNDTTLVCPGNVNLVTAAGYVLMASPKTTTSGTSNGWQVVVLSYGSVAAERAALGAAPLASPALTGTPTAPTATTDTNTTQIATTEFVRAQKSLAVAQAATSGTFKDFTNIPAWVKKITVMFASVSTSGISPVLIQIGDSGGIETTLYASTYCSIDNSTAIYTEGSTIGFIIPGVPAVAIRSGILTLTLLDSATNTWVASGAFKTSTTVAGYTGGDKSLSATLDRVRITTTNGTDTFDAGKINILYE